MSARKDVGARTVDISIFEAFPNAIVSGVWQIGVCQHGTVVGNTFTPIAWLNVIIDEGNSSQITNTPESINSDILIYAQPDQMPTTNTNALVSSYMLYDTSSNFYYNIVDAGIGRNQHTGNMEHIELRLSQTEVVNG